MPSFNRCVLVGNLGRKPELRYTPSGKAVSSFGLAVNRKIGDQEEEVLWIDVVAWEKQAEACAAHLDKGSCVLVDGRLKLEEWEDREGEKRRKIVLVAGQVVFLDRRAPGESPAAKPAAKPPTAGAAPPAPRPEDDDEIPF